MVSRRRYCRDMTQDVQEVADSVIRHLRMVRVSGSTSKARAALDLEEVLSKWIAENGGVLPQPSVRRRARREMADTVSA